MTDTLRKIDAAKRLAESTDNLGERNAALAAIERLTTKSVVAKKAALYEGIPSDPFGPRSDHRPVGPRPVVPLLPHQRMAWLCLAAGAGKLSRSENSFLHRMRESRYISPRQQDWLRDIDVRLRWEAGI
ncbi:hypothetical protein [Sphingopyxis sp.]|uniref:hypothetical protein n=1 Tax=Sphingopyxis sp. TaxID=1908224 RepID=UPI0035B075DB